MAVNVLREFKAELSLLVFVLSIVGMLVVIPAFFFQDLKLPVFHAWQTQTEKFHVWIFLGAAVGLLGGGWYFFSTLKRHFRFRKLMHASDSRAALKRNIKELEELAPDLPSWRHAELDDKREELKVK